MPIICMIRYFFENSSNNRKLVLSAITKNNHGCMVKNIITDNIEIFVSY